MTKNIIVLGYRLDNKHSSKINNDRLSLALGYYHQGDILILSGGDVAQVGVTEAQYMNSITPRSVYTLLDNHSCNTIENIINCRNYINDNTIIVTHEYHQPRVEHIQQVLLPDTTPIYICVPNESLNSQFISQQKTNEKKYFNQVDLNINT